MSRLSQRQIQEEACRIILSSPTGIRYSPLVDAIHAAHPETPRPSIEGAVNPIGVTVFADEVTKPERGLFLDARIELQPGPDLTGREEDFYPQVVTHLKDSETLTSVIRFGGSVMRRKWTTPDVLGVYRPAPEDIVRWSPEIIAVEVKIQTGQAVVAFGQAVAYQFFAAKVYLALPRTLSFDDQRQLTRRCMLHGLGLLLLGSTPTEAPKQIIPARRGTPDIEATREFLGNLRRYSARDFNLLFSDSANPPGGIGSES